MERLCGHREPIVWIVVFVGRQMGWVRWKVVRSAVVTDGRKTVDGREHFSVPRPLALTVVDILLPWIQSVLW